MTCIAIPDCLRATPTLDALLSWCENNRIFVSDQYVFSDEGIDAFYHHTAKTVYLARNLPEVWKLATLAHEIIHAFNEHDGHQPGHVEAKIDEAVARAIINPEEYAYWETELGWSTGGIARELDQPRWVIEAYRRVLATRGNLSI